MFRSATSIETVGIVTGWRYSTRAEMFWMLSQRGNQGGNPKAQRDQKENITYKTRCKTFYKNQLSIGAGEGNRTLVCSLGSCRSTIELRPQTFQVMPRLVIKTTFGTELARECQAKIRLIIPTVSRLAEARWVRCFPNVRLVCAERCREAVILK